jgi:hypothetical protein
MAFWKSNTHPEKFCVTSGNKALMITHKSDEIKIIEKPLDAGHAANIKARYSPDSIEDYPFLNNIINLFKNKSWTTSSASKTSALPGRN